MRFGLALSMAALVAACSGEKAAPEPSETADAAVAASEAPQPAPSATEGDAAQAKEIPAALHGRWGLVPADCTTTRGDDKGLLTVSANSLRHYESVGKLRGAGSATATSFSGTFDYTGEGMNWTREVTLFLRDDGKSLDFRDSGADAPSSNRTYKRCD